MSSDEFSIFINAPLTIAGPAPMDIRFPLPPEAVLRAGKPANPGAFEKWKNGLTGQFAEYGGKTDEELLVAIHRLRSRQLIAENRVYLDTSVFIYALHGSNVGHDKAEKLLKDIADGLVTGVTSNFAKYEYRGYLKDSRATVSGTNATKAELDELTQKLDEMIEDFGIEEISADVVLGSTWISDCETIVDDSVPTSVRGGEWVTVRGADGIHALIAIRVSAQKLATLDNAFKGLKCAVQPLVLWDV